MADHFPKIPPAPRVVLGPVLFRATLEMDARGTVQIKFNKQIPISQWISILAAVIKGNADQMLVQESMMVGQGRHLSGLPPGPGPAKTDAELLTESIVEDTDHATGNGKT